MENTIKWLKKYSAILVALFFLLLQINTLMEGWYTMTNTTKILEISLTIFAFFTFLFFVYYTQVRESIYESQIEETTENNEEDNFNDDIDNQ